MPDLLQDINNLANAKRLFDKFNQAINGVILDGRFEDRGLYIDIEDDIITKIIIYSFSYQIDCLLCAIPARRNNPIDINYRRMIS